MLIHEVSSDPLAILPLLLIWLVLALAVTPFYALWREWQHVNSGHRMAMSRLADDHDRVLAEIAIRHLTTMQKISEDHVAAMLRIGKRKRKPKCWRRPVAIIKRKRDKRKRGMADTISGLRAARAANPCTADDLARLEESVQRLCEGVRDSFPTLDQAARAWGEMLREMEKRS